MHEVSIAQSILEIAEKECRNAGHSTIQSIEVVIGSASGILPDSLLMVFEILKDETLAAGASLVIREIPLGGSCRGCGREFTTEEQFVLECPHCGSPDFRLLSGRELNITAIEVQ